MNSRYATRIRDVVFPGKICRACLLTDSDAKYVEMKRKYEIFKGLLGIEVEPADINNGWLCLMCSSRISSAYEFCISIRQADSFLKILSGQLKRHENHSIHAALDSLRFFNAARKNLSVTNLPILDIRLSTDTIIKTESTVQEDVTVVYPIDIVKHEELQTEESDPLMSPDYDSWYGNRDSLKHTHEDIPFVPPEGDVKHEDFQPEGSDPLMNVEHDSAHENCEFMKIESHPDSCINDSLDPDEGQPSGCRRSSEVSPECTPAKMLEPNIDNTRQKVVDNENVKVITIQLTRAESLEEFNMKALDGIYTSAKHKCTLCLKVFALESTLSSHMQRHDENQGKYDCFYCHQRFKDGNAWYSHQSGHTRRYKCAKCDFTRLLKRRVEEHYTDVHEKLNLKDCQKCGKSFKTSASKRNHVCGKKRLKCDQCGKMLTSKNIMISHIGRYHSTEKLFSCPICKKKYASEKLRDLHERQNHNCSSEPLYCVECDSTFRNKLTFAKHLKFSNKHMNTKDLKLCPHCPEQVPYWKMESHINNRHLKTKLHKCGKCNRTFCTKNGLQCHIRKIHDKTMPLKHYICEICGRMFKAKQVMITHLNIHTGARPYKCSLCPAAFGHSASLFTHNKLVHLKLKRRQKKSTKPAMQYKRE